jgi:hypothetical protein
MSLSSEARIEARSLSSARARSPVFLTAAMRSLSFLTPAQVCEQDLAGPAASARGSRAAAEPGARAYAVCESCHC